MEFLARLSDPYARAASALKKSQARYKRAFDRSVRTVNKEIRIGDQVYLDTHAGATTRTQREEGTRKSKLDYPVPGPFPVIDCLGHTYEIPIDGVPELFNADRVRCAPRDTAPESATPVPATINDSQDGTDAEGTNDTAQQDEREFEDAHEVNPEGGYGAREFIIDKLTAEGIDDAGAPVFRVRWKGYPQRDETWEPEGLCLHRSSHAFDVTGTGYIPTPPRAIPIRAPRQCATTGSAQRRILPLRNLASTNRD